MPRLIGSLLLKESLLTDGLWFMFDVKEETMNWFLFGLACQDHSAFMKKIERLEKSVELQEERIRALERAAEGKKKKEADCTMQAEGVFQLSRAKMKAHAKQAAELPRILPYQKDGVLLGVRLADVNTLWENCGFQNGDVVLEVNGSNIRSQRMLQVAYEANQEAKALNITLRRREKRIPLVISLTDP
ncbi:MAG: hypothetical protein VX278_24265 [Myxococcota bacterium]|nr:hypothetical protein [Myxococcota bacterium]